MQLHTPASSATGLQVTVDAIRNTFMRRAGRDSARPPVMTGSHIDTQPTGGKFDGNYVCWPASRWFVA
jgi:N-carbamoyl-L-amino-acid hydrolase